MLGVFDSGVGGLTVVKAIREKIPDAGIIYLGDTARMPYGSKSPETIIEYSKQIADWLVARGATQIVIACHTASAIAAEPLREYLSSRDVPVIDVVRPGLDEALEKNKGKIGIIGTRGTIASSAHEKYLKNKNPNVLVFSVACPLLAPLVEEGFSERPESESILRHYLGPLIANKIDTLVLACTHYPLLRQQIEKIMPATAIVDPAASLANSLSGQKVAEGPLQLFFTDMSPQVPELIKKIFGEMVDYRVEKLAV